jgi:transposase
LILGHLTLLSNLQRGRICQIKSWLVHIIDKGIPTTGLLAQVLVAKFLDHLPLYRQERIFERAGLPIARSTLAQWVGECGAQLQPLADALRAALSAPTEN